MSAKKTGRQTVCFSNAPAVVSFGNCVGRKEGEGPLGQRFDTVAPDDTFGQPTWEKAERAMLRRALTNALDKRKLTAGQLDFLYAGDLLNQCISAGYAARGLGVPFFGLYGACSTMGEGLILAAMALDGGFGTLTGAAASSHFCSAERQYRTPLEYGGQRPPTTQWTVTGAGAVLLGQDGPGPFLTHATVGTVTDLGIKDPNNMGAAMAPAAADTVAAHLRETGRDPGFYDLIVTGDLGSLGSELFLELLDRRGIILSNHADCGCMIFDPRRQDVHCGGSGCGCCASVLTALLLPGLQRGKWEHILFCPTGALHSPTATFQGESIPGICHAVALSSRKETLC